MMIVRLS